MRRLNRFSILCAIFFATSFIITLTMIISNVSRGIQELLSMKCEYPELLSQTIIRKTSKLDLVVNDSVLMLPSLSCNQMDKDSPVQRAILIYYPVYQKEHFFPEIRWYYRSWAEMLRGQPPKWRTDFVIYASNFSEEFRKLGCVNRLRQNKEEPSTCRLFIYVPARYRTENMTNQNFENVFNEARKLAAIHNDDIGQMVTIPNTNDSLTFDPKRSKLLYKNLRTYDYTDSINILYEGYHTYKMYDFVVRTDSDGFIYRHFSTYVPENCTFIVGLGGYTTKFNQRRLERVSHDMSFRFANLTNMGSTWYSSAYDAFVVANLTLYCMLWLHEYEFTKPEREWKLGTLLWPEWHYGVLLLYGQHIALNHLVATNQMKLICGYDLVDQSCNDDTIKYVQHTRLHLHAWHTERAFSKFAFKRGEYNQTHLEKYRNDTTALGYAMRMALESKFMTLEQLANLISRNGSSMI